MTVELLGWIIAAGALGLWWGERGRRIDAQLREVKRPVIAPPEAKVTNPEPQSSLVHEEKGKDLQAVREKMVEQCISEGFSRAAAEKDVDDMLARLNGGGE